LKTNILVPMSPQIKEPSMQHKRKMPQHPTPRQLQLLKAIVTFADKRCYLPTITELAEKLNLSRSTIFEHIDELRKKQLLASSPLKARSLKPTSKALRLLKQFDEQSEQLSLPQGGGGIPLLGKIAAGNPIDAAENKENLSLNDCFGSNDNIFALEVTGDSMIEDDIREGDYVICKQADTAANGQLVVALTGGENTTLKRFYKEKSKVRLQPANRNYAPIYSDDCQIQAVAVGLIRKLN
jgi:repressor LexA